MSDVRVETLVKSVSDLGTQSQTFGGMQVERWGGVAHGKVFRFRVEIDTAYPFQSRISSHLWTSAGWVEVFMYSGKDRRIAVLTDRGSGRSRAAMFEAVRNMLACDVEAMFFPGGVE